MKKVSSAVILTLLLSPLLSASAMALEYRIDGADEPLFAVPTSFEPAIAVGEITERSNIDRSKNAALTPPDFGTFPVAAGGSEINYSHSTYPDTGAAYAPASPLYTLFTDSFRYADGSIGRLTIPSLGVDVKIWEGETTGSMAKGAAHFSATSVWDGNVAMAGHNRGTYAIFGQIHTLNTGDTLTLTTVKGTRTYEVFFVGQVEETDVSMLNPSVENIVTLITCVRDIPRLRWCVQAKEIVN